MTGKFRALLTAIVLVSWATPSVAITPEQKTRVRELVKEGGELRDRGDFSEARDRFLSALELARVPAVALYAARAHESLRELLKAAQLYRLASEMPLDEVLWDHDQRKTEFQARSREEANVALRQLLERNCTVRIQLVGTVGADLRATLDGIELDSGSITYELPVLPGSHAVVVTQGSRRNSQIVNLGPAEHKTVTFELTLVPTMESRDGQPQAQRVPKSAMATGKTGPVRAAQTHGARDYLTWMAYGIGAAGLGTGIVAGIVTLDKRAALVDAGCTPGGSCSRDSQIEPSSLESHNTWRAVTTVGFVVGGVGAAAGLTLTLTQPKTENSPRVVLHLAPDGVSARGTF